MHLYQLNQSEYEALRKSNRRGFLVVESQVYGQPSDMLYHVAVGDNTAAFLDEYMVGRSIEDTGRTVGFWQNLGGKGVLGVQKASTLHFSEGLLRSLKQAPEAQIRYDAPTWEAVIRMMPLPEGVKEALNVDAEPVATPEPTKVVSTTRKKKSKKSNKK